MKPAVVLLALSVSLSGCFSWWGDDDAEAASHEEEPDESPIVIASDPRYVGAWTPKPAESDAAATAAAANGTASSNGTAAEDAPPADSSQDPPPAGANDTASAHAPHEHEHGDAAADPSSSATGAAAANESTTSTAAANETAPPPPAPPAPRRVNKSFDLVLNQAPFIPFGGGGASQNCVVIGGNATSSRIVSGTAVATWDSDSPTSDVLELVVDAPGKDGDVTVRGRSPLSIAFNESAINATQSRPAVWLQVPPGSGSAAFQQLVTLDLVLDHVGGDLKFGRTSCG